METTIKSLDTKEQCLEGYGWYMESDKLARVMEVEEQLKVSYYKTLKFKNMTRNDLEIAAEMFIYLVTCAPTGSTDNVDIGRWFKMWAILYNDLFKTKPADEILLTLNRILNADEQHNFNPPGYTQEDDKARAKKLFNKITTHVILRFPRFCFFTGINKNFPFFVKKRKFQVCISGRT